MNWRLIIPSESKAKSTLLIIAKELETKSTSEVQIDTIIAPPPPKTHKLSNIFELAKQRAEAKKSKCTESFNVEKEMTEYFNLEIDSLQCPLEF